MGPIHDRRKATVLVLRGDVYGNPVHFIIDSGAERSVLPKTYAPESVVFPNTVKLNSVDGRPIATYGHCAAVVGVRSLRRNFKMNFILTDTKAILGADFLVEYGIALNMKDKELTDPLTGLKCTLEPIHSIEEGIRVSSCHETSSYIKRHCPNILNAPDYTSLPNNVEFSHSIATTGPPLFSKPRILHPDKLSEAKKEFDNLMKLGIVRSSNSPWASPLHMVKKANGSWRPCGDYRRLNAVTTPDRYAIPNIQTIHHRLSGSKIFSRIDLVKAYHFIPMAPDDIAKTAICTPFGTFEYNRMPFGLRNAASTFQRFIDSIFRSCDFVVSYIDDLLIFSETTDKHEQHLQRVFKLLDENGLKINESKSELFQKEIQFLGFLFTQNGIKPLPDRVSALENLPPATDAKVLQRYIGMFSFYQRCVPHFSETIGPLRELMKQPTFSWTSVHDKAFADIKQCMKEAIELAYPMAGASYTITADASSYAIGACIHQVKDGSSTPLGFFSRKLSDVEKRYSTFDRELLAIYASLRKWKNFVEGSSVTIFTDHKPLVGAIKNGKDRDSERQQRQIGFILELTDDIVYIPGKENIVADVMSRSGEATISTLSLHNDIKPTDLISIAKEQDICKDDLSCFKVFKIDKFNLHCNVSCTNPRPYIPLSLRFSLFVTLHSLSHPGWKATCRIIGSRYFWPTLKDDVKRWCQECEPCQKCKVGRHVKRPLSELPCPSQRFTNVHIDIVGPLEQGCDGTNLRYIVTMVDSYTRWMEAVPVAEITAEVVCKVFIYHWVSRFGPPLVIISDRGKQFCSELLTNFTEHLGVNQIRTSGYNPKANGIVERMHRTLKAALRARGGNWLNELPIALLGMRMRPDENGSSAFARVTGEQPMVPHVLTNGFDTTRLQAELHKLHFPYVVPRSREAKSHFPAALKTCKYVWLRLDRIRKPMEAPYQGPFEVIHRSDLVFTLLIKGKPTNVAVERLKPAVLSKSPVTDAKTTPAPSNTDIEVPDVEAPQRVTTRSGRHVRFKPNNDYVYA